VRGMRRRLVSAAVALLGLGGCVAAPSGQLTGLALKTSFGPDTRGIQTEVLVPRGSYRLEVECDRGEVIVTVKAATESVREFAADCGALKSDRFDLAGNKPVEMSLTVETESSTGEARLIRLS